MFHRFLSPTRQESFFLFGPSGTGKATLLHTLLPKGKSLFINLLDEEIFEKYLRDPKKLELKLQALDPRPAIVVIDEVQRLPKLLNHVHRLIERKDGWRFALTGSSARKLKRGAANLLAGRAFTYSELFR